MSVLTVQLIVHESANADHDHRRIKNEKNSSICAGALVKLRFKIYFQSCTIKSCTNNIFF